MVRQRINLELSKYYTLYFRASEVIGPHDGAFIPIHASSPYKISGYLLNFFISFV